MAAPAFFLGIDVSRSGLGLALVSGDGSLIEPLRRAYGSEDGPGDPQDWWRATRTGIKELLRRTKLRPEQIRCIGVTGDEACVAIDRAGKVLCPATLGPDPRAEAAAKQYQARAGTRNLLNLAGAIATSSAMASKLHWLRENEKRVWHDLRFALSAKDFIRFRLTEAIATDACEAGSTLLFNPRTRSWSRQLMALLEINPEWLPPVTGAQTLAGRVTESAARESGLTAGTPVVTGAGHAAAIAIATGSTGPGSGVIELGGQGSLFVPVAEAPRELQGRLAVTCHALPGSWALAASELASSAAIDWLAEHITPSEASAARRAGRDPLDALSELAAEIPPGSDGLMFLPPTNGFPGGLIGLARQHGRGHLVRAVMEGGALACRQLMSILAELHRAPAQMAIAGPGAASPLWCQILADVLDRDLRAVPVPEAAAVGVATVASCAVGTHKAIEDAVKRMVKAHQIFHPRKAAVGAYANEAPILARLQYAIQPPQPITTALVANPPDEPSPA